MTRPNANSVLWHPVLAGLLLSRVPLPRVPDGAFDHAARAAWAYPLVGLALAIVATGIGSLAPTPVIGAGLALAAMAVMTGGLHEDGLADTADGLWGGHDRAQRLEIMKDSRIGAYGVLALVFVTGLRWAALAAAGLPALIASAALSRGAMPAVMAALPHARDGGLARSVGRPSNAVAATAALLGLGIAAVVLGAPVLYAVAAVFGLCVLLGWIAKRKIGGQTGDILGATQQVSEAAVLIILAT